MTQTEFLDQVERIWRAIETQVDSWADQHGLDIQAQRLGPVLECEFASGRKIVMNAQTPMQQIWLASPRGAFHFQWHNGAWCDTRASTDFWNVLAAQASLEAGVSLAASRARGAA